MSLRIHHVGIVVDDLEAATAFFVALGMVPGGTAPVEGAWVDRVIGLEGVRAQIAMLETPDGSGRIELSRFESPPSVASDDRAPANALGIRHVSFQVERIDSVLSSLKACGGELIGELERYEDVYRLCYVRGPAGIIVELAERID